jgi:hypothetical protein
MICHILCGGILKKGMKITIRLTDNEHSDYVKKGRSMYSKRMRRMITDEEYIRNPFRF